MGKGSKNRITDMKTFRENFESINWEKSEIPVIIQNAIKINEKGKVTYIKSHHRNDFQGYTFENGAYYFTDGGTDYLRRGHSGELEENCVVEDFSIGSNDNISKMIERFLWKRAGKPETLLKYLTKQHLEAILKTQDQIKNTICEKVILEILKNKQ